MATTPRPKPFTLDLGDVSSVGDLRSKLTKILDNADFMFRQLYEDLSSVATDAASAGSTLPDPVTVPHGGTGKTTLTAHGVVVGEGNAAAAVTAAGAANTVLHGTGATTDPSFSAVVEADLSLSDNTTADLSTTKHGFTPKAPNDTSKFLRGDASWAAVPAGEVNRVPQPFAGKKTAWFQHVLGTNSVVGCVFNSANLASTGADFSDATYFDLSVATSGTVCHASFNGLFCYTDHLPTFRCRIKTGSDLTTIRIFAGLTAGANFANADTQTSACVGVRYSTVVPDGGFVGIAFDNTAQAATATICTIAINTVYVIEIIVTSTTSATFNIYSNTNGTLLGTQTLSSRIPTGLTGTKQLRPSITMVPQVSATRHLYVAWGYAETAG